jgi:cation diffusion facilitator CzcD-associated flavoprotein CzcO
MNGNGREGNGTMAIERHADHRVTKGMDDRRQVEETADRIRDELLLTLEELDRRRERVLSVRYQAEQHKDALIGVAAVGMIVVGTGIGFAIYRARHREELLRRERRKALRRAWEHPDQVAAKRVKEPALASELGRKLVLIFASALATRIAQNSVQTLVPARRSQNPAAGDQKIK